MLRVNGKKLVVMLDTSKRTNHLHIIPASITVGNAQMPTRQSIACLRMPLDCVFTMNGNVLTIA